jgi:ubiquinone/menaquinone biosynthesis C-methylase UbiE
MLTACQSGIFEALRNGPLLAAQVAAARRLDARAVEVVLLALTAEGILRRDGDRFSLVEEFTPALLEGGPDSQAFILRHNWAVMQNWSRLLETLQTGRPVRSERGRSGEELGNFIRGMADILRHSSVEVAEKLDLSPFRRMLDVGGGPAAAGIAFCRKHPKLRCVSFDLPEPTEIARDEIAKAGLSDRIEVRAGSYFTDELGEGFDLVYLSNIIHSMSEAETLMLLAKCRRAMLDGGLLVIKDFLLDEDRAHPPIAAYFSVNMLVNTDGGKSYTEAETRDLMRQAGFGDFRTVPVAMASRLLLGCAL